MNKTLHKYAVTLLELLIVLLAMSIIAGFGIPIYFNHAHRAYEKKALSALEMIHSAEMHYRTAYGQYWPLDTNGGLGYGVRDINRVLRINLIEQDAMDLVYNCTGCTPYGDCYRCTAQKSYPSFTLRVTKGAVGIGATNPCCSAGTCFIAPRCP